MEKYEGLPEKKQKTSVVFGSFYEISNCLIQQKNPFEYYYLKWYFVQFSYLPRQAVYTYAQRCKVERNFL